jgi:DNA-binding NtrC family response regulator
LAKPFTDEELFAAVGRALTKLRTRRLGNAANQRTSVMPHGLIGESKPMRKVFDAIGKAATSTATVLISGESGTGKELVARAIHYDSARSAASFVPINCGGIPEGLLESELFGYTKGAFTGAMESRAGFFQTAEGGSLLLDEISETSLNMQVKLLRVLQDKEVYMVGSTRGRQVDVRVLASTNKNLLGAVKNGLFREDLYFRLHVLSIELPPLRERGDDVVLLVHHFVKKFARELGNSVPAFSDKALHVLRNSYTWPGNVRELENVVHRLVVMTEGDRIEVSDLPAVMRFSALRESGLRRTLAEVEAEHIRNVFSPLGQISPEPWGVSSPDYSCRVGRGRANPWWGCANQTMAAGQTVFHRQRPKPHHRKGLLVPPYNLMT